MKSRGEAQAAEAAEMEDTLVRQLGCTAEGAKRAVRALGPPRPFETKAQRLQVISHDLPWPPVISHALYRSPQSRSFSPRSAPDLPRSAPVQVAKELLAEAEAAAAAAAADRSLTSDERRGERIHAHQHPSNTLERPSSTI